MARPDDAQVGVCGDSAVRYMHETPMQITTCRNSGTTPNGPVVVFRGTLSALLYAASTASAAASCWIDEAPAKTADQLPISAPAVAPLDRLARDINAVLHGHPVLAALPSGPTPVRLRTRWSIGYAHPDSGRRSLWLQWRDHRTEMWVGACSLSPRAERIAPRASIVVHVDAPDQLLENRALHDEQLTAWPEPPQTGRVGPHPVYFGWLVVLSANGRPPWLQVSMDEYLRFHERELLRGTEGAAQSARDIERFDGSAMERQMLAVYENLKKIDPAAAEKTLAELRAQMPAARATAQREAARGDRQSNERLDALRAFRASLPPSVLQGPARLGWTEPRAPEVLERMPRLVKIDPAWTGHHAQHEVSRSVRVIGLKIQGRESFEVPMQQVLQTLDYAALTTLLSPVRQP